VQVRALWRHPIKGHGVEAVAETTLAAGRTMPWDRVWAIAHAAARVAPGATAWANCVNFGRGAKSAELMAIRAEVDEVRGRIRLTHPRRPAIEVDPDDPADAARLVAWVTPLSNPNRPAPAFIVKGEVGMTDSDFPSISVLNTASLAALGERLGKSLAMERFRGNVWLDGLAPFGEFDLVGRDLRVGDALLAVRERITRCVATSVDPSTGISDADTLGGLEAGWNHRDFGVYAAVTKGGRVAVGDPAVLL
jgi:uncharacterized protein YcbX